MLETAVLLYTAGIVLTFHVLYTINQETFGDMFGPRACVILLIASLGWPVLWSYMGFELARAKIERRKQVKD